jgi:long-chain-fatty-acid---luciferin-component ligase
MNAIELLIEHSDPFRMNLEEMKNLRFKAIKDAFIHHYSNNPVYRRFCEKYNVTPEDIRSNEDLLYIPLLPSEFFKELSISKDSESITKISSLPKEKIVTYFTTSGTTGKPSKYPYDRESIERVNRSNVKIFYHVVGMREDDYVLMLSPPSEESLTGLVRGMYMCMKGLLRKEDQIGFAIKGGVLDEEFAINMISSVKGRTRHLYGPPFVYNAIADYALKKGRKVELDKGSKVVTTGGWKKVVGEIKRDELNKKIEKAFGIEKKNIRDGLGLTDIMSILMECEYHYKHVPPWMHVSIRDPKDLKKEVKTGEPGLIAFMSPLIESYPAFIITGDMGVKKYEEKCVCGMNGPTLEYLRRADGLAARGCAIVLDAAIKAMRATE